MNTGTKRLILVVVIVMLFTLALGVLGGCGDPPCDGYCYRTCQSGTFQWVIESCTGSCPRCPGGTIQGPCNCWD